MKRACSALVLLALAALTCGSCGPAVERQSRTVDGVTITLEHARETPINREQQLIVFLTDQDGRPIEGATVALDMLMPAMPMGQNKPLADPLGGGRYRVRALFSMLGDWKTTVRVTIDGKQYEAVFDQVVVASSDEQKLL
jgi:hypothetical protein